MAAPSEADWAYAAGLLDGEGYFSHADTGRIRCDMTAEAPVRWLAETFAGTINGPYIYLANQRKPVWKWTLCKKTDREAFILGILPFLKVKRAAAMAMLDLVRLEYPGARWNGRTPMPESVRLWRAERARLQQILKEAK